MNKLQFAGLCFSLAFISVLAAGCGGSDIDLATVQGTVTLDGQPLPHALVSFQPQDMTGSPSYGGTDASGQYELMFTQGKAGAMIGKHTVTITEGAAPPETEDDDGDGGDDDDEEMLRSWTKEAEVTPGRNTIDFPLP